MNKTIYVGIIGAVVVFISGVGVVAAEGHLSEAAQHLFPSSQMATTTQSHEVNENESVTATSTTRGDDSEKSSVSGFVSESNHLRIRGDDQGEHDQAISNDQHGDDQSEGDDNESENESGDDGFRGATQTQPAVTPSATTGTTSNATFTMAQVAAHASVSSCYTAIGGSVYDLTPFIGSHPGGVAAISSLCGIDGTAAFSAQHGGQGNPAAELATLKIGTVI